MRRVATAFAAAFVALFAVGVMPSSAATRAKPVPTSTTPVASATDVKSEVEARIVTAQQTAAPGLRVGRATCPKTLAVSKAQFPVGTFRCTVIIEGVVAPYEVVLSKGGGFKKGGTYAIAPASAIIDVSKVIGFVRSQIDPKDLANATISCGKAKILVLSVGKTFDCAVLNVPALQKVTFIVKDNAGTIAIQT